MNDSNTPAPKAKRGFGAMDPARVAEIARKGGMSVKPESRSFSKNRELAAEAGRKGGSGGKGKSKTQV